jgi:hypothetical protein
VGAPVDAVEAVQAVPRCGIAPATSKPRATWNACGTSGGGGAAAMATPHAPAPRRGDTSTDAPQGGASTDRVRHETHGSQLVLLLAALPRLV